MVLLVVESLLVTKDRVAVALDGGGGREAGLPPGLAIPLVLLLETNRGHVAKDDLPYCVQGNGRGGESDGRGEAKASTMGAAWTEKPCSPRDLGPPS